MRRRLRESADRARGITSGRGSRAMTDIGNSSRWWQSISRRRLLVTGGATAVGLTVAGALTRRGGTRSPATDHAETAVAGGERPAPAESRALPGTLLLGRPTGTSIDLSCLVRMSTEVVIEYAAEGDPGARQIPPQLANANEPLVVTLRGLEPDRAYLYRVLHRVPGLNNFAAGAWNRFRTARSPGAAFTFTVQADSHRDDNSNLDVYRQTLEHVRADGADFHIDLGDTFMCDKFARTRQDVIARYVEERSWFGIAADSIPLFLVNGNHEGEAGWLLNGGAENLAIWAAQARLRYYLNPVPNAFYSGDVAVEPFVGQRASYYAWVWGSAQFIVLDPFWFTKSKPGGRFDNWSWTLGDRQYQWLQRTLAESSAALKFVFIHHLVGGNGTSGRGGVEAVPFWEWGASATDFASKRPGWRAPIHRLLVEHGVNAVFHGHDHLYARQDIDGLVYQEVPQPSHLGDNGAQLAAEGGYRSGVIRSSSGHLRVSVVDRTARVEYVRTTATGAAVEHAYTIIGRS